MTAHIAVHPTEFSTEQLMHTVLEAASILRVGRSTIYVLISNGSLRPVHIGRAVRISRAELERYVARLDAVARRSSVDKPESPSSTA